MQIVHGSFPHLLVASVAVLALDSWIVKQHSGGEQMVQHMQQEMLLCILRLVKSISHLSEETPTAVHSALEWCDGYLQLCVSTA